jgi:histidinol-phosphate aminotransferase
MSKITYAGGMSIEQMRSRIKTDKIYKMSSNENPLGPSAQVVDAIQAEAASLNLYPDNDDGRFREALAAFHGRGLTQAHFFTAVSGVEVLELLARTFLQPGDEAIVCPPLFGWYVRSVEQQGGTVVTVPLHPHTFTHNIDAILAAITPRTRFVYLCNPHNPTGTIATVKDMARLVASMPPDAILIADEVYTQFVTLPDFPDSLRYVLDGKNVVIIQSFSKAYGLAGMRLGYAIAPPSLCARVWEVKRPFHLSRLAITAGITALLDQTHLHQTVTLVQAGKQYLYEQLDALDVTYWHSEANFVLIRPLRDADYVYEQLIERGIMVRPTAANGLPGHLRVTIGLPEANEAFMTALTEIINIDIKEQK